MQDLKDLIALIGDMKSDTFMDPQGRKLCQKFDPELGDPLLLLRNLLDLTVRYSWACGSTVMVLQTILSKYPESETDKETRRRDLLILGY